MAQHKLLRSQSNDVFNVLRDAGLDPEMFEWETRQTVNRADIQVPVLVHRPTDYFFQFDYMRDGHYARFSPGRESLIDSEYPGGWPGQLGYVYKWIDYLKREIEAPDLWSSLQQERLLVDAATSSEGEDRPFTQDEVRYISGQLHELKEYIFQTQQLSSEQHEVVELRLNYLADSATRQNRTDWLHTLTGVLLSLVFSLAMSSDGARELFRFAGAAFRQLLSSGSLPALP